MSDQPPVSDFSRLDAHMASVRRVALLNASWKFALAGAAGATAIIGAVVVGVWVAGPRFSYRTIEVPHIVEHDLPFNNPVPHDKPFDVPVPRLVPAPSPPEASSPLARTPSERRFENSAEWKGAIVKGRILRADQNGFAMLTEHDGEKSFFPARIGADGKIEFDPTMRDVVEASIGELAFCRQGPNSAFECTALGRDGREVVIPQVPVREPPQGRPT